MSPPPDRLRVVAHFPGRLRVRAETFRILPEVAAEVVEKVGKEAGVSSVTISEVTGSLLILYDPHQTQLLRLLRAVIRLSGVHGVAVDEEELVAQLVPGAKVRRAMGGLDERVRRSARGKADLRTGVPASLALMGLGTLLAGRFRFPEWYDLLFWSFTSFATLNPPERELPDDDVHGG